MSIKDITLGRYVHGTSIIHQLDPRTKLMCIMIVMAGLFSGNGWIPLIVSGVYTIAACLLSGLSLSYLARSVLPFKWLIIVTILLNMLFVGGHISELNIYLPALIKALLPYGGITQEGIELGLLYGGRIALLVLSASLLTLTTEPVVLVSGIEKLLAPLSRIGIKPHEIATAMVITIRFIPVLLDEAVKIRKSHVARGFKPGKGLGNRLRSVTMMLMPLLTSSIRRAEHLAIAMDCRLFHNEGLRTRYKEIRMALKDWAALFVTMLYFFVLVMV